MRETKFRAAVDDGILEGRPAEVYEVVRLDWSIHGIACAELFSPKTETFHTLDAKWFELIEFTGLRDRNGKEVYTGDIVRVGETVMKVVFHEGSFHISWLDGGISALLRGMTLTGRCEVIGSIYENSEVLRGYVAGHVKEEDFPVECTWTEQNNDACMLCDEEVQARCPHPPGS